MRTKKEIHPIDIYAGNKLREARKLRGLSQDALGKELPDRVTFQQIQKYERGINRISISTMYEFVRVLQVPVDYFVPTGEALPAPMMNNREEALLDDFRKLSARSQNALTALISAKLGGKNGI